MKNTIVTLFILCSLFLLSCGPAAEDRQVMHARAKIFQDSLADLIKSTIAEAEGPAQPVQQKPNDTASQRVDARRTATVK